jgi:hypothetical protein
MNQKVFFGLSNLYSVSTCFQHTELQNTDGHKLEPRRKTAATNCRKQCQRAVP